MFKAIFKELIRVQKENPDDLGCRSYRFKNKKEYKAFMKKNKEKIDEAIKQNSKFIYESTKNYN